ncbi:hypothetical protein L7F22_062011 [Adiantum nelumboides]|nr:hypothetical protein [Adiantum nelumboides]
MIEKMTIEPQPQQAASPIEMATIEQQQQLDVEPPTKTTQPKKEVISLPQPPSPILEQLDEPMPSPSSSSSDKSFEIMEMDGGGLEIHEQKFTPEEYMKLYTTAYNMCSPKPPYAHSKELYARYREAFYGYINTMVLSAIDGGKHSEIMLMELVQRWENHNVMVYWLTRFFNFLECYYIQKQSLPSLYNVANSCFRDLVYQKEHCVVESKLDNVINDLCLQKLWVELKRHGVSDLPKQINGLLS